MSSITNGTEQRAEPIDGYEAALRIVARYPEARDGELERMTFERVKFGAGLAISMEFLRRAKFDAEYDAARRLIHASLSGMVPALGGDQLVFPKSWWDHFKRDIPRRWKLRLERLLRRPLTVETEVYEVSRFVAGLPEPQGREIYWIDRFRERSE